MAEPSVVGVFVTGIGPTVAALSLRSTAMVGRATLGLIEAAELVKERAKANMATHHYTGRAESLITVSVPSVKKGGVAIQAAYDSGDIAAGQALNAQVGVSRGGSAESGGAIRSSAVPALITVTVGIHPPAFAPEGATFEKGWRSKKGKQPPTEPIALWVLSRGITGDAKEAKHIAFVVARNMKNKGYSFGEYHWLRDAWASEAPMVQATVARFLQA